MSASQTARATCRERKGPLTCRALDLNGGVMVVVVVMVDFSVCLTLTPPTCPTENKLPSRIVESKHQERPGDNCGAGNARGIQDRSFLTVTPAEG